jgi:endoglycosylceramidase
VVGFDVLNEPHWGSASTTTFEPNKLQPFYERVIREVRSVTPWLVFAEPSSLRNIGFGTRLSPFDGPDVVYAPHMYDPLAEGNGSFDPARRDGLIGLGGELRVEADALGAALWIGEYGGRASDPQIAVYMDATYDAAAGAFAGSAHWSYDRGGGYGLLDEAGQEVTALVDAVVRPYPERIAGTPVSWHYDDAARVLSAGWEPDANFAAPTVIVAPTRVYPTGVAVQCDGCTAEVFGAEVHAVATTGEHATITVAPL